MYLSSGEKLTNLSYTRRSPSDSSTVATRELSAKVYSITLLALPRENAAYVPRGEISTEKSRSDPNRKGVTRFVARSSVAR